MNKILTLLSILASFTMFAASPSYSNFSSNQFAPSATYTVTVKSGALLTNIIDPGTLSVSNSTVVNMIPTAGTAPPLLIATNGNRLFQVDSNGDIYFSQGFIDMNGKGNVVIGKSNVYNYTFPVANSFGNVFIGSSNAQFVTGVTNGNVFIGTRNAPAATNIGFYNVMLGGANANIATNVNIGNVFMGFGNALNTYQVLNANILMGDRNFQNNAILGSGNMLCGDHNFSSCSNVGNGNCVFGNNNSQGAATNLGSGNYVAGIGNFAGANYVGDGNIAIGVTNFDGLNSQNFSSGSFNIGMPAFSGRWLTNGSNNIFLGMFSGVSMGLGVVTNVVAIGYGANATSNNQIVLGTNYFSTIIPGSLTVSNGVYLGSVPTNGVAPPPFVTQPIGLFGSMCQSNTTNTVTITGSGTYVVITNYQTIRTNQFTAAPGWAGGFLTNLLAGYYRISIDVTCVGGNSDTVEVECFVNGAGREEISALHTFDNPARIDSFAAVAVLYLPANSYIGIALNNRSAANNITVQRAGLTIGTP